MRSVADQRTAQVSVRHHIRDGGSSDGSLAGLPHGAGLDLVSAPDQGMYDALNRAWTTATGDYVGLLNADEQYLPGSLTRVVAEFARRPEIDVLYAGFIVTDEHLQPLCYRRPLVPDALYVALDNLPVFTCATFVRRGSFADWSELYDTRYRAAADADWFLRMRRRGVRMGTLDVLTSLFMLHGKNLSLGSLHRAECAQIAGQYAHGWQWTKKIVKRMHHIKKKLRGHFAPMPVTVTAYPPHAQHRTTITAVVTGKWPMPQPTV